MCLNLNEQWRRNREVSAEEIVWIKFLPSTKHLDMDNQSHLMFSFSRSCLQSIFLTLFTNMLVNVSPNLLRNQILSIVLIIL